MRNFSESFGIPLLSVIWWVAITFNLILCIGLSRMKDRTLTSTPEINVFILFKRRPSHWHEDQHPFTIRYREGFEAKANSWYSSWNYGGRKRIGEMWKMFTRSNNFFKSVVCLGQKFDSNSLSNQLKKVLLPWFSPFYVGQMA